MMKSPLPSRDLQLLEEIANDPAITQANLADKLDIAVGTVNFAVKRLVAKGYVRVKRLERKRLKYIVTPEGIALRTRLAMISIQYSMRLYRETRLLAQTLLGQVKKSGHAEVRLEGEGDLADIVRLTCMENGVKVVKQAKVPLLKISGSKIELL
jgi:DNA-binding MarR family transcriptional regulator